MKALRSAGAILAGYVLFAVCAAGVFAAFHRDPHEVAPPGFLAGSTLAGMLFAIMGGYLAARLAGLREAAHAAGVGLLIAAGAVVSMLNRPPGSSLWSQTMALVLMAPSAVLGGLAKRKHRAEGRPPSP